MFRLPRFLPLLAIPLVAVALAGPRAAAAQEAPTPQLNVRGQGIIAVRPDVALVTMGASVRRESAGDAFVRAQQLIAQVNEVLRANGVPESDVQTRQFSLSPEFGRAQPGEPAPIVAWRSTNILSIKIRDFSTIGAIIDQAARVLGNEAQISGIGFTLEDTDGVARRARDLAIADARRRAEQIAAAAGVRLVRILSIFETSAPQSSVQRAAPPPPPPGAAAAASAPAEVSAGELNVQVSVEIVYEIG